jgi:hypothetical protein
MRHQLLVFHLEKVLDLVPLRACLKSPGRQSSTARDRFRNRKVPLSLGGSNRSICPGLVIAVAAQERQVGAKRTIAPRYAETEDHRCKRGFLTC